MSTKRKSHRKSVTRHDNKKSIGTELPPAYGVVRDKKGSSGFTAAQQAGLFYSRAANRAGRPPLG